MLILFDKLFKSCSSEGISASFENYKGNISSLSLAFAVENIDLIVR